MEREETADRVRLGIEAAKAIVVLAEGALHGGEEVDSDKVEELVRRARAFGGPQPPGQFRDAQRSLANAAQALSDAARFERDRKRSRSPDGQKRNWLARNMALSTARLNAAMAEMHLASPDQPATEEQLHELTEAVTDLSVGVHETAEQVAKGADSAAAVDLPDEPQPPGLAARRPPPRPVRPHRRRRGPPPRFRGDPPRRS